MYKNELCTRALLGGLDLFDQRLGERAIMRLTAGQDEGKKTAFSISN
jgi:hypothetical protein